MARNNKINMPTSTAGITRYFDDYKSRFQFQPGHIIVLCILIILVILLLFAFVGPRYGI